MRPIACHVRPFNNECTTFNLILVPAYFSLCSCLLVCVGYLTICSGLFVSSFLPAVVLHVLFSDKAVAPLKATSLCIQYSVTLLLLLLDLYSAMSRLDKSERWIFQLDVLGAAKYCSISLQRFPQRALGTTLRKPEKWLLQWLFVWVRFMWEGYL